VELTETFADDDILREDVLEHVEAAPSFRLSDGAAPLPRSAARSRRPTRRPTRR